MFRRLAAAAAAGLIGGALMLAGTAHANHNTPDLIVGEVGECGEVTFSTAWTEDGHLVDNARLIVDDGTEVHSADIGDEITVGPFEAAAATIHYRIFGGGERDYDVPLWNGHGDEGFTADIVDHAFERGDGEEDYSWTTAGVDDPNPFVNWLELEVEGCPAEEPTEKPTEKPTDDPTEEPATEKADEELAVTGSSLPMLIGAGLVLLVGGGVAVTLARRRGLV